MIRLAREKLSAAQLADELSFSRRDLATNGDERGTAFGFESFERSCNRDSTGAF